MNNMRKIRKERGLTQFELAKLSNINPSSISNLESGKIYFYPGWLKRIAEVLEVDPEEIIKGGE